MTENVSGPMGRVVSSFVTTFNPGNAPAHAGPPDNRTQGPPDHAGPPDNKTQGPPDHAGPPEDRGPGGEETEDAEEDQQRGPPAHAKGR